MLFVLTDVDEPVTDLVRIREAELIIVPEDEPVDEEDPVEVRVDCTVNILIVAGGVFV